MAFTLTADTVATFRDLTVLNPWRGFVRAMGQLTVLVLIAFWSVTRTEPGALLFGAVLTGLVYFNTLLLSHDSMHRTLTGWRWFDGLFARVVAYPGFWPHGTYRELHLVHHRLNGIDARDPERRQPTAEEYAALTNWGRWRSRAAWWFDPFVLGAVGMIANVFYRGVSWARSSPRLRRTVAIDVIGILFANGLLATIAHRHGVLGQYVFVCFAVERIAGGLNQVRSHLEHFGLWSAPRGSRWESYALSSQNFEAPEWVSLFFGRLNFHSAHHVFPQIPYYHLKEAHRRLKDEFAREGLRLPAVSGYFAALHTAASAGGSTGFSSGAFPSGAASFNNN